MINVKYFNNCKQFVNNYFIHLNALFFETHIYEKKTMKHF